MKHIPVDDVARLWLALTWIIAGGLKTVQPAEARAYVRRRIGTSAGFATVTIAVVCVCEIAIGGCLLAGLLVMPAAGLAVALLATFTWLAVSNPEGGSGCGCFGAFDATTDNRWVVIARNGTMTAVAILVMLSDRPFQGPVLIRDPLAWLFAVTLVGVSGVAYFVALRVLPRTT